MLKRNIFCLVPGGLAAVLAVPWFSALTGCASSLIGERPRTPTFHGMTPLPQRRPNHHAPVGRRRGIRSTERYQRKKRRALKHNRMILRNCARKLLGRKMGRTRRDALTFLVRRCFGGLKEKLARLLKRASFDNDPRPGDIIVFERNQCSLVAEDSGHLGCNFGVILDVSDSKINFAYISGQRLRKGCLDLKHPDQRRRGGRVINSFVRTMRASDPPGARYLAGELLSGFASLEQGSGRHGKATWQRFLVR